VALRAVSDFILERDARREGKKIVGDKSPNSLVNGEAVRNLHKIYPDAYLVFLVRDGRDAVFSHRIQTFIDNPHKLAGEDANILQSFLQDPDPYLTGKHSLFTQKGLTKAAKGWVENVVETDNFGRQLYGHRYLSLRFEDLLSQSWEEMTQNPDADWQREKAEGLAQSLVKGRHGSWRDVFTPQDKQIFHQLAGDTLESWNYDLEIAESASGTLT
jgi:hypothetical protein